MNTILTEVWGATYLEVLVILLVFVLGVPALIIQIGVKEQLRTVVHDNWMRLFWPICALGLGLVIACGVFLWWLHPAGQCAWPREGDLASLVMTSTVAVVWGLFCYMSRNSYLTKRLLIILTGRVIHTDVCGRPSLDDHALNTLIYVGEVGEPGGEGYSVLNKLSNITRTVCTSGEYVDGTLEHLLRRYDVIVTNETHPGNDSEYLLAVGIARLVLERHRVNSMYPRDARVAMDALERLGVTAVRRDRQAALVQILSLVRESPSPLFKIGRAALDSGENEGAVEALGCLEALAERMTSITIGGVAEHLLGLAAHFWSKGGAARQHATAFVEGHAANFAPSLGACFAAASAYYNLISDFATVDRLTAMSIDVVAPMP